ncbi:MAG: hypothetical protein U0636_12050 [Phycisphaerales bacterium]
MKLPAAKMPASAARLLPPARVRLPLAVAALSALAVALGWGIHSGRFTSLAGFDRATALRDLNTDQEFLRTVRTLKEKRPTLDARLASVSNATLGDRLDVVDGALRARLNRIAEETGLRDLMVATSQATERRNPARPEMLRLGLPRALREETDFVEVRATLTGDGAMDQVLRLVHRVCVDPMVKRVESVKFDPGRDGARIRVTMKLVTIYLPGVAPKEMPGAPSAEALAGFAKYAVLAQRNPFRLPEPPAAPPATAVAAAPAPDAPAAAPAAAPQTSEVQPGFPYSQWLLTGIIDGPAGTEAWFRNTATREARVLHIHDTIAEFALVGLAADGARMSAGGATYLLRVGDALDARVVETASK